MASKYRVNDDGVAKARQMIDSSQYDTSADWSDALPSADEENAKIERPAYAVAVELRHGRNAHQLGSLFDEGLQPGAPATL